MAGSFLQKKIMELTKEQTDELQDLVDSLRKVPGNLILIADGAFSLIMKSLPCLMRFIWSPNVSRKRLRGLQTFLASRRETFIFRKPGNHSPAFFRCKNQWPNVLLVVATAFADTV